MICVPRISNTNRHDLAIEFVNWSDVNEEDKQKYTKLNAIIKERVVGKEVIKSIKVVDQTNGSTSPHLSIVPPTSPEQATATLVYETLSPDIFDDVSKILQANEILSQNNKSFKFDQTIYYRVYANRDKLKTSDKDYKLLAVTGLRFYAPCLFWFNFLRDDIFAEALREFVAIPKFPSIKTALMISILLGNNACDWIERKIEASRVHAFLDDKALSAFKKMKAFTEKDDLRLAAIQKRRSSEFLLPDKTRIKVSEVLKDDAKVMDYLTKFCQKVAAGGKKYHTVCRLLDVLAFGTEIEKRSYKITKFLCT